MLEHLHFLRPWWLLLLPLSLWLIYHLAQNRGNASLWQRVCDPALLKWLQEESRGKDSRWPWWILAAAMMLTLVALAGPAWQQIEQPLYRQQQALVILLDLSRSMLATDNKPDRLTRAKQKLSDLLASRKEGQTALVAYAGDAFVITPLTDDVRVIAQQLPVLTPKMMPVQGSRLDLGLKQALQLFKNSGVAHGNVLVLTDSAEQGASEAEVLHRRGHRVSVLGFGSADGAPIPGASGFVTDQGGNIVVARTDWPTLRQLAQAGGGRFARVSLDNGDLHQLTTVLSTGHDMKKNQKSKALGDLWREEGVWLLLLLLPLAATAFRRGWLLGILIVTAVSAPHPAAAWELPDLWHNHDQQARQFLDQGKAKQAASRFDDPRWKAAAHYRAGEFTKAADTLANLHDADSDYNRGNALAKAGKLDQAIAAYNQALEKKPDMKDAAFNRDLIQKLKQQQAKQQQQKKRASNKTGNAGQNHSETRGKAQDGRQQKPKDKQKQGAHSSTGKTDKQQKSASSSANQQKTDQQKEAANRNKQQRANAARKGGEQHKKNHSQQSKALTAGKQNSEKKPPSSRKYDPELQLEKEQQQAQQQWLRRIPDDPGGLLRRKFQYQYRQRGDQRQEEKSW